MMVIKVVVMVEFEMMMMMVMRMVVMIMMVWWSCVGNLDSGSGGLEFESSLSCIDFVSSERFLQAFPYPTHV